MSNTPSEGQFVPTGDFDLQNLSQYQHTGSLINDDLEPKFKASPNEFIAVTGTKSKAVEETKKMINNFREKTANYPKYMSYEGSMVLCVLLSMKSIAAVHITHIPIVDQNLIREILVSKSKINPAEFIGTFDVKFDQNKDFILIFNPQVNKDLTLNLINTVAHPRNEDLKDQVGVPVGNDGEVIAVGGRIHINKRTIQESVNASSSKKFVHSDIKQEAKQYSEESQIPYKQVGRNAYEIRADVLQMAIHWAQTEDSCGNYKKPSDEDVIALARKFYSFVENKR